MLGGFYILICINVFKLCLCHRRTVGNESVLGKKYMVYFVKSSFSKAGDDSWICAGALVSPTQILTAATCLIEMERIYAIAGYKKYVRGRDINNDECTKMKKQKVVMISFPKEYQLPANKPAGWISVDIGIATVEKPYNFSDQTYLDYCSYVPKPILINYEIYNELEKTNAVALGWGGHGTRSPSEPPTQDMKSLTLWEAPTVIVEKDTCAKYTTSENLKEILDRYLLCASDNDFLEDCPNGRRDDTSQNTDKNTCILYSTTFVPGLQMSSTDAVDLCKCINKDFDSRRKGTNVNETDDQDNLGIDTVTSNIDNTSSRSLSGTCQNYHGGPLVSSIGVEEMIIGVALKQNYDCGGPHLYVSTAETAIIIKCLLEMSASTRYFCNEIIDDKGYKVDDIEINWPVDINYQSSIQRNTHKISRYVRRNNEEEPLHVRPTHELDLTNDEPENQQQYGKPDDQVNDQQMNQKPAEPYYQPHDLPQEVQGQPNEQYRDQALRTLREQPHQPPYNQVLEQLYEQPREESSVNSYKPHQEESYGQLPQVDSNNQPQIDSYNQPQIESRKQPQVDSYNQPQMESHYQPQIDSYNQPQVDPRNQPQIDSHNQPQMDSHNPPQVDSYNQPQMESHNQPQVDSYNQPQVDAYNLPQMESHNQPQVDTYNQPQMESHNQPQVHPYIQPPAESLNQSHIHSQIESFTPPPSESYNPLDQLLDDQIEAESFKLPIVQPYLKKTAFKPYIAEPFKLEPVETFEQPHLHKLDEPQLERLVQPFQQQHMQPNKVPPEPYERQMQKNILRELPQPPTTDPPEDGAQSIDQMFSQLYSSAIEPQPASEAPEQTFEELYKNLHQPTLELPHDQANVSQDQASEQPLEQQFDPTFNQMPKTSERIETLTSETQQEEIKVRHQMPLDYPEYLKYSRRNRNNE